MTLTPFTRMAAVTRFPGTEFAFGRGHTSVFFKDTKITRTTRLLRPTPLEAGEEALTFKAVNGAGDSNILSDAVDLLPLQPKPISDITLDYVGTDQVSIDFGRSLSFYGRLHDWTSPKEEKRYSWRVYLFGQNRRKVTFGYSRVGIDTSSDVSVSVATPIFLTNRTRQYRPSSITFRPDGKCVCHRFTKPKCDN